MLQSILIRHYKALKELRVDGFSRINLIGGQNNVGKSSLLEAIFLFFDRLDPDMWSKNYAFRAVNALQNNPENYFALSFSDFNLNQPIEFEITRDGRTERVTYSFEEQYEPTGFSQAVNTDGQITRIPVTTVGKRSAIHIKFQSGDEAEGQESYLMLDSYAIRRMGAVGVSVKMMGARNAMGSDLAPGFSQMRVNHLDRDLIEAMRKAFPEIGGLEVIVPGGGPLGVPELYATLASDDRPVPLGLLGDGTYKMVECLIAIGSMQQGGIVLFDEMDRGFHYSAFKKIWEPIHWFAEKRDVQLIATTHSYECVLSAAEYFEKKPSDAFKFIRLEKEGESRSKSIAINAEDAVRMVNKGLEIR